MKKTYICTIAVMFLLSMFSVVPIATPSEKQEETTPSEKRGEEPVSADREAKAYELFNEILTLTDTPDIKAVLPQMEALYLEIIRGYPDTALAQESCWRLISLYVEKYTPPEYEKAETLYTEFLKKYPVSAIKDLIDDTLSRSYYKNEKWIEILKLYSSVVDVYKEKGKLPNPNPMFMYAEAKYNLGDLVESEKAYKIVIELFPTSNRAVTSMGRLEDIKKRKANTSTVQ
jgi:tetratricopeptide (TPR) repeat protein